MIPHTFPQANTRFTPPPELDESQCRPILAYGGVIEGGSCDGSTCVVVAYELSPEERERVAAGAPIFLTQLGGLSPHYLSLSFQEATHPA